MQAEREGLYTNGEQVLRFSNKFLKEIEEAGHKGYTIGKATINHIVYWYPKDVEKEQQKEIQIILPNLEFVKQ